METLFVKRLADARDGGHIPACAAWMHALTDILSVTIREPLRAWRRRAVVGPPRERRPLMLGADVRYAIRALARQKLAATLAVTMLALGIAANVAVFSLVNGLFLRPFPFPEPERLVYINETAPRWNLDIVGVNYPDFHHWRLGMRLFEAIALFDERQVNLSDGAGAELMAGLSVTHDFDNVLGIAPTIGRFFTAAEDVPKGPPVVVIGHGIWQERFGGRSNVLGRQLRLDGVPHTIVGVMPPAAEFPSAARLWLPMAGNPNQEGQSYGASGIGRLKSGVSIADAQQDLVRAHQPIFDTRDRERVVTPFARSLREQFVRDFTAVASVLSIAVALLLVVACANVASVMLAHAIARRRDMSIRLAVGASRARVVRQLLVENVILAAIGGVMGAALGRVSLAALLAAVPDNVPPWARFEIDARVVAFAMLASIVTVILFGWAPALHAVRGDLRGAMTSVANAPAASPAGRRTLWVLVGAEFAMATLLVVCGAMLARAYDRVRQVDPGFRSTGVLLFRLALPDATYPDEARKLAFWDTTVERMRALPGVEHAGVITCPPLDCHWGNFYRAEGATPQRPGDKNPVVLFRFATPGYFPAMGVRLEHGRFLEERDGRDTGEVPVVVNETFVRTFFPGVENPVGRRIRGMSEKAPWRRVVGVAEDVRHYGLENPMRPGVYFPLPMDPADSTTVVLHTRGDAHALAGGARAAIRGLDPELPLFDVRTIDEALGRSVALRAVYSWLLGVFAALGLVLALAGTYGVTSYLVTQRMREMGIRVSLGAGRGAIVSTALRGSLAVASIGVCVGVGLSLGLTRFLSGLLFGVDPRDAAVLSTAAALLLTSAAAANWWPARRAARVDPVTLLRAD